MIGQVTGIAMARVGWRYYLLFVVCNFTNAVYFWIFLPETKQLPLEEMHYIFTHAPWIVPGTDAATYRANYRNELDQRAMEIGEKLTAHEEEKRELETAQAK